MYKQENLLKILGSGGVAVMPTDTIYGLVGKALEKEAVKRIYQLKFRSPNKPFVILISNENDLEKFGIFPNQKQKEVISKLWPGPNTLIFDCTDEEFAFLHRGKNSLAFRVQGIPELRDLVSKTGPLIATSANTEGSPHAKNISEAKKYFGENVDIYIDGGEKTSSPSRILKIDSNGNLENIR